MRARLCENACTYDMTLHACNMYMHIIYVIIPNQTSSQSHHTYIAICYISICSYRHTCIHAYIHTDPYKQTNTNLRTICIHTDSHRCMSTYIHTCIHTCMLIYRFVPVHVYVSPSLGVSLSSCVRHLFRNSCADDCHVVLAKVCNSIPLGFGKRTSIPYHPLTSLDCGTRSSK